MVVSPTSPISAIMLRIFSIVSNSSSKWVFTVFFQVQSSSDNLFLLLRWSRFEIVSRVPTKLPKLV